MKSRKGLVWSHSVMSALRRLFAPLVGSGRGLFGILALLLLFVVTAFVGWEKWGDSVKKRPQFALNADSFDITPQPPWIHSDIKAAAMRDGGLAELSLLDPDLTKRVVQAFELNAWVAEAVWASKRAGKTAPRVIVQLRYREPVIMVRTRDPRWKGDCFWPVDTEGMFLPPEEFSANQTRSYLRVEAGNPLPAGAVGTSYGDPGVTGAAKIAEGFKSLWTAMGLEWILVRNELPQDVGQPVEPTYLLLPTGAPVDAVANRRPSRLVSLSNPNATSDAPSLEVRWGHAPGREAPGEASASEKIASLREYVGRSGRLDQLPPTTIIDLRPATGPVITDTQNVEKSPPR
ncbi:MAG: hypothetical protein ACYC4N_12750 [Pirellulaceae bacterium]